MWGSGIGTAPKQAGPTTKCGRGLRMRARHTWQKNHTAFTCGLQKVPWREVSDTMPLRLLNPPNALHPSSVIPFVHALKLQLNRGPALSVPLGQAVDTTVWLGQNRGSSDRWARITWNGTLELTPLHRLASIAAWKVEPRSDVMRLM